MTKNAKTKSTPRQKAREFMMQVFFQMEICNDFDINNRETYFRDKKMWGQENYCNELFSLICNKKDYIDEEINRYCINWKIDRMPKTDLAILRISACELCFMPAVPKAASINEAVEMAKKYGTKESPSYVNAILGKIYNDGAENA